MEVHRPWLETGLQSEQNRNRIAAFSGGIELENPFREWRSVSADVALSEKSPYLGGVWVRLGFSATERSPEDFRDRDRSSGGF
jgi:hypothetical protein